MKIEITYKHKNDGSIKAFELTLERYYDPIEEGKNYEEDSIPQYDQTIDYIRDFNADINEDVLEYSILSIHGSVESDKIIKTTYFENGSDLIYRKDFTGWELIIQSIRIAENCAVITRMERPDSNSDWININFNTVLNYNNKELGNERWFSAKDGEYIKQNINVH